MEKSLMSLLMMSHYQMAVLAKRELVFHPGGVAVIAVTEENKNDFCPPVSQAIEKVILEIPAGKIDPGEGAQPELTGARELEEETGYRASTLEHAFDVSFPGLC